MGGSSHENGRGAAPGDTTVAARMSGLEKTYNAGTAAAFRALDDVTLDIARNEFFTLLGPSGCGKTTLLRLIGGFEQPTAGTLAIFGQEMAGQPPENRPVNTVFQHYALFPHLTVRRNIGFSLEMLDRPKAEVAAVTDRMLALVGLEDFANRMPAQLSGGQKQRVALARALAPQPKLLLLDEPLSALDLKLRQRMRLELKALQRETGITFVFVTHDQEEALAMSDRIAVLSGGRIQQLGTPEDIYERPVNRFVADFIGDTNLLAARVLGESDGRAECEVAGLGRVLARSGDRLATGCEVTLCTRPERMGLSATRSDGALGPLVVRDKTYLGNAVEFHVEGAGRTIAVRMPRGGLRGQQDFALGATVFVSVEADATRVLVA